MMTLSASRHYSGHHKVTENRTTQEHLEKGSGEGNVDGRD